MSLWVTGNETVIIESRASEQSDKSNAFGTSLFVPVLESERQNLPGALSARPGPSFIDLGKVGPGLSYSNSGVPRLEGHLGPETSHRPLSVSSSFLLVIPPGPTPGTQGTFRMNALVHMVAFHD